MDGIIRTYMSNAFQFSISITIYIHSIRHQIKKTHTRHMYRLYQRRIQYEIYVSPVLSCKRKRNSDLKKKTTTTRKNTKLNISLRQEYIIFRFPFFLLQCCCSMVIVIILVSCIRHRYYRIELTNTYISGVCTQ